MRATLLAALVFLRLLRRRLLIPQTKKEWKMEGSGNFCPSCDIKEAQLASSAGSRRKFASREAYALELYCNADNLEQARMMAESEPQMAGGTVESRDERHLFPMLGATTIVLLIAACKLVVHLYAGHRYGYLGDELYFLACSRHLAWS